MPSELATNADLQRFLGRFETLLARQLVGFGAVAALAVGAVFALL